MKRLSIILSVLACVLFSVSCEDKLSNGTTDPNLSVLSTREQGIMILQACNEWVDNANLDIDRLSTVFNTTKKTVDISYKRILRQDYNSVATDSFIRKVLPYTDPATGICSFSFSHIPGHYILDGDTLIIEPADSLEITIIQDESVLHGKVHYSEDILFPVDLAINTDGLVSPQGTPVTAMVMAVPKETRVSIDLNGAHLTDVECRGTANYTSPTGYFNSAFDSLSIQVSASVGGNDLKLEAESKANNIFSVHLDWSRSGRLINMISVNFARFAISRSDKLEFEMGGIQLEINLTDSVRTVISIPLAGKLLNLAQKFIADESGSSSSGSGSSSGGSSGGGDSNSQKSLMRLIATAMNEYLQTSVYFRRNPIAQGKLKFECCKSPMTGDWTIGPKYTTNGMTFTHENHDGLFDPAEYDAFVRKFSEFLDYFDLDDQ